MTLTKAEEATNYQTFRHIERVRNLMGWVITTVLDRCKKHDQSKLETPEVEVFAKFTSQLKEIDFGSAEYQSCLEQMKPALDHHYANNRHHPEYHLQWMCMECERVYTRDDVPPVGYGDRPDGPRWCLDCYEGVYPGFFETRMKETVIGISGMNLIDLIEMFCDWKAASERHASGDIMKSIDSNAKRFSMSPQLVAIFQNTAKTLHSAESPMIEVNGITVNAQAVADGLAKHGEPGPASLMGIPVILRSSEKACPNGKPIIREEPFKG